MRYLLILIALMIAACSEVQPQVSLLTSPSNLPVVFNDFTPSTNPTNSTHEISISALDIGLYSELKWAVVHSLQTCEQVDFESIAAQPVSDNYLFLPTAEGLHRVCVIGKNHVTRQWQRASEATESKTIEIDRTPPEGDFVFVGDPVAVAQRNVEIKLNPLNGAFEYAIFNNTMCEGDSPWLPIPTNHYLTHILGHTNADNVVAVQYRDRATNKSQCFSRDIKHDSIPPGITIANPVPYMGTILNTFTWEITYTDADQITLNNSDILLKGTAIAGCAVNIGTVSTNKRSVSISNCQQEGQLYFDLKAGTAQDIAGNRSNEVSTGVNPVTISNTRPTVQLVPNIARNSFTNSSNIVITATFSSDVINFTTASLVVTGGTATVTGFGAVYSINFQPTTEGLVKIKVSDGGALDALTSALSLASEELSWTYDITAPVITNLADDPVWKKTKIWTPTCSESCTYAYSISNSISSPGTNYLATSQVTTNGTESGTFYLNISAKDRAGNISAPVSVFAKLDNTQPTITGLHATNFFSTEKNAFKSLTESPTFSFYGSDNSGTVTFTAQLRRRLTSSTLAPWAPFVSGSKLTGLNLNNNEEYTFEVKATDPAGNESAIQSIVWKVDMTIPENFIFSFEEATSAPSETPRIIFPSSPTDNESGVYDFNFEVLDGADNLVRSFGLKNRETGLNLTVGNTYKLRAVLKDHAGNTRTTASLPWAVEFCPVGYVRVPNIPTDFCVAKYEMKNVTSSAASVAAGTPWINVRRGSGPNDINSAWNLCHRLNGGVGSHYNLISNAQWQTIARDIELTASNWSGGNVGSGSINRGYTDAGGGYSGGGVHALNDVDGCGENKAGCDFIYRRTHTLSNGSVTYDLSGNVWEWVRDDNTTDFRSYTANQDMSHKDVTSPADRVYSPANPAYGELEGMGLILSIQRTSGLGVVRGGRMTDGFLAGIYAVNINIDFNVDYTGNHFGFRCVYEP